MIKVALVVGGSFAVGKVAGSKLADAFGVSAQSTGIRLGVEVGTGIIAYMILASVL